MHKGKTEAELREIARYWLYIDNPPSVWPLVCFFIVIAPLMIVGGIFFIRYYSIPHYYIYIVNIVVCMLCYFITTKISIPRREKLLQKKMAELKQKEKLS